MSTVNTVMQTIVKGMKALTKDVEKMSKLIEQYEAKARKATRAETKSQAKPGPQRKAARGPARQKRQTKARPVRGEKTSAIVDVLEVIRQNEEGVTTSQIKDQTGFSERKIWDNVNRLKRQGKVKSLGRGLYVCA